MTSDTVDELAKKINKALHGLGCDFEFTKEGEIDKTKTAEKENKDTDDDIDA